MHDPLMRGLASEGKSQKRSDEGTRGFVLGSAPQARVFSGFQYPTPPLHVSGDFMNTALRKALAPALGGQPG